MLRNSSTSLAGLPVRRGIVVAAACLAPLLGAPPAHADECAPAGGVSPCVDADALWMAPDASRFFAVPSARSGSPGTFTSGFAATFLSHPIVLRAASPDPGGRDVVVVDKLLDATILERYAANRQLDLQVALPLALYQSGSGVEGVTSQSAAPLARNAVRDPRLGAGWVLHERSWDGGRRSVAVKARLELALPLGDRRALAGEPSLVGAPSMAFETGVGRFHGGALLGARLREATSIAGSRVGNQAVAAVGTSVDILPRGLLSLGVEAWVLPVLVSQDHTLPDGTRVTNAVLAPSEWLAAVRSSPGGDVVLELGGGSALPLSSEHRAAPDGTESDEHFAGLGSPTYRFVFAVRYAPRAPSE